jgi:arylsulfatase A-like enzyme
VAVLTADHGFTPAPEVSQAQGRAAARVAAGPMVARVNAELEKQFGVAKLVRGASASALVMDRKLVGQPGGLDFDKVVDAARAALAKDPAIAAAYTRRELQSRSRAGAPFFDAMERSWDPERSGDVQYAIQPFHIFGSSVATHGSPHPYDTHVPLMFWGPRWVKPGMVATRAEPVDIAPTLAGMLGVRVPASSEGRPLPLR